MVFTLHKIFMQYSEAFNSTWKIILRFEWIVNTMFLKKKTIDGSPDHTLFRTSIRLAQGQCF